MNKFVVAAAVAGFLLPICGVVAFNLTGGDINRIFTASNGQQKIPDGTLLYFYAPS